MRARARGVLVACAAVAAVWLSGCVTTTRMNPAFPARRAAIKRVAVVPPDVTIVRLTFKGDNALAREEVDRAAARLPGLIAAELRGHGFEVKEAGLDERRFAGEPDLRFRTTQVQRAFLRAQMDLYETEVIETSKANRTEQTLGPLVNRLADHAAVDGLVVSTMVGLRKSWGEFVKDVFVAWGGAMKKGAILRVGLIDGDTGDILWANSVVAQDEDFQGEGLDKMVKSAFREFPKK